MTVLTAFDVDNLSLADALREVADGVESGRLSVVEVETTETADADSPGVEETVKVRYVLTKEDGPVRPLRYEDE